jgi:hypothetical protein
MISYGRTSPWAKTKVTAGNYLDFLEYRDIPKDTTDVIYELEPVYTFRPDLLAFDLYGTPKLWWVFAVRNPDTIKDPVFDFVAGTKIYLPKKSVLSSLVGV